MFVLPAALTASWVLLQLLALGASAIKCQKTETAHQPHLRDCGPDALGCRVIVKPYQLQNNSAVSACRSDEKPGDFVLDCAVDCPARSEWDWNEVLCCKKDDCNRNLNTIRKKNYCYTAKAQPKPGEMDTIVICPKNQKCAINTATGDTGCVPEANCKGDKWSCCSSTENCGEKWGIHKTNAKKASGLTASLALSAVSLAAVYAARF